jgi:PIN domain nuclease of toxin-antitoxin system
MRYLLDTHVWLWSHEAHEKFGRKAQGILTSGDDERVVSAISTFEIARLIGKGRLILQQSFASWSAQSLHDLVATTINVTHEIAWEAYSLPGSFHKDPADRLLIATARLHDLTLLTADDSILNYRHVKTASARR